MSTAYALARRGVRTTIIDANPRPGMGASWGNGRQLSYAYTDALASPALWRQIPGLLGRNRGGISLSLSPSVESLCWLARFARNMTASRFRKNTLACLDLARKSRTALEQLQQEHQLDFGHRVAGKMHLFDNAHALDAAQQVMGWKIREGASQCVLTPAQARELEPALKWRRSLVGAIYTPDEAIGDGARFCHEMSVLLGDHYGATLRNDTRVTRIARKGGATQVQLSDGTVEEADTVVLCTGATNRLARAVGVKVPVLPMKGYSFTAPKGGNAPSISLTDAARKIVFTDLGDRLLVAGIAELGEASAKVDPSRIDLLISLARQSLPEAANYKMTGDHWAGLRPMTPNSLPIIGEMKEGIAVNMGHGMLGWTLAMGSGETLAAQIA